MACEALPQNLRVKIMPTPADGNIWGRVHGGFILTHIDNAGGIAAIERSKKMVVTVAIKEAIFLEAGLIGDLLNFYACVVKVGRTSLTVDTFVEAERFDLKTGESKRIPIATAQSTYVAIGEDGTPIPVDG